MGAFKNVIEILQLLDKSNCGKCGEKACMAFAGAVLTGKKKLADCPTVDRDTVALHADVVEERPTPEDELEEAILSIRKVIKKMDFPEVAERVQGL
jgi:CO dehydrogenase/acetyl-CoA synthase gamma subunit (corrinoid Fe-S protein)